MLTDSLEAELQQEEKRSLGLKLIAGGLALLFTACVLAGYVYFRNRHARQNAVAADETTAAANTPKGPPKAHILVDEPLLKGGQTIIGGSVKNISNETLSGLAVELELKRRKDGTIERMSAALNPAQLESQAEGRYSLKLPAQTFGSVKLVALRGGSDSGLLSFTTGLGQKRPLERLEPKVIVVPRQSSGKGGFLNSPDNPARVP
jgi:hypothetical protein